MNEQARNSLPSGSYPLVIHALIFANVVGFVWELSLGSNLPQAIAQFAIIPARYAHPAAAAPHFGVFTSVPAVFLPFFSSMFLHGGWIHLGVNMWYLQFFGTKLEERLGEGRFLLFYLAGGVVAGIVHVLTNASSLLPVLGASGAIAAVMGGYFGLFPTASIKAPIPPLFFGPRFLIPAWVYLGSWFLLQFFSGVASLATSDDAVGGVAWWAHIGGFAFGWIYSLFALPPLVARARER